MTGEAQRALGGRWALGALKLEQRDTRDTHVPLTPFSSSVSEELHMSWRGAHRIYCYIQDRSSLPKTLIELRPTH